MIWFAIFNIFHHMQGGRLQAIATSAQEISTDEFDQAEAILESNPPQTAKYVDEYTKSSTSPRHVAGLGACSQYQLSKLQEEKRHNEVARTPTPLRPTVVSAKCISGSFRRSFIDKAPRRDF